MTLKLAKAEKVAVNNSEKSKRCQDKGEHVVESL